MELKSDASLIADRHRTLDLIQLDKTRVAIGLDEVAHLDSRLTEAWGIRFLEDAKSIVDLLARVADRGAADRFIAAHDEAVVALSSGTGSSSLQAEKTLFDAIAHPEILGPVTSMRRHIIVDGLAVALGLIRTLELKGEVLDVGCHAGFVGSLLTEVLQRRATGIDPSAPAIALGRSHPASSPTLNLVEAAIPWNTDMRFDFAVAIDAMPQERTKVGPYLQGLGGLLNPAGIAVVMSSYWVDADVEVTRRQLRNAGLGFGYADVAGGYGDIPPKFQATGFLVLLKGGTGTFPRNIRRLMESEWHYFKEYANTPATAPREKTQSFERAKRRSRVPETIIPG